MKMHVSQAIIRYCNFCDKVGKIKILQQMYVSREFYTSWIQIISMSIIPCFPDLEH